MNIEIVSACHRRLTFELDGNGTGAADVGRLKRKGLARTHQARVAHDSQQPLGATGRHHDYLRTVGCSYATGTLGIILCPKQEDFYARSCSRSRWANRYRVDGIVKLIVTDSHVESFPRLHPRQVRAHFVRIVTKAQYPQVKLVSQVVRMRGTAGGYRFLHMPAGSAGAPGQKIAGSIGIQAEIGMRLVGGVFIQLRIKPTVVAHGVKLDE